MHTSATSAFWPEVLSIEMVTPMMATRNSQMHMTTAPQMSSGRRPKRSIAHMPGRVMKTLTMLVATWVRKGFLMPELRKKEVP